MRTKLDIKDIQNMNLFERITGVKVKCCFEYDSTLFFVIEKNLINRALANDSTRRLYMQLKKRVKITPIPRGLEDLNFFVSRLLPNKIKKIEIQDNNTIVIYSMPKTKATIIGKNKIKFQVLSQVLEDFFEIKKILIK